MEVSTVKRVEELPDGVAELVLTFRTGLLELLDGDLVALYLLGSVIWPGFHPGAGDIDFHAVVRRELGGDEQDRLEALHVRLADELALGRLLDGFYIPLAKAGRGSAPAGLVGAGDGGIARGWAQDGGWEFERAHAHAGAFLTLLGPDASTIYPEPAWDELAEAVVGELPRIRDELHTSPIFCALNLCRLTYSVRNRDVVVSKVAAGNWALEQLDPRWHDLIRAALAGYAGRADEEGLAVLASGLDAFYASSVDWIRREGEGNG